jgi:hypothetical protein
MFCQYRDALGEPRRGAHAARIPLLNWALVDTLLTVIAAWIISRWTRSSFWIVLLILVLVGLLAHALFCVPTTMTKALGLA